MNGHGPDLNFVPMAESGTILTVRYIMMMKDSNPQGKIRIRAYIVI